MTSLSLHAEEARWISLDGQPVPAPKSYYNSDWESEVVAPGEKPCLQLLPAAKRPARGTVIIAPGGGYENLSTSKEGSNLAKPLNEAGWDAVVLVYTVGKKEDKDHVKQQALTEAKQALSLVQKRGMELGLSTTQVGAMGFSAGGHLVLRLAHEVAASTTPALSAVNPASIPPRGLEIGTNRTDDSSAQKVVRLAQETTRSMPPDFLVILYPGYLDEDNTLLPDVAPPMVPIFLCVGDKDRLLSGSNALDEYCRMYKIPCDYVVLPGVGHGFGLTNNLLAGAQDWPAKLTAFLSSLPEKK